MTERARRRPFLTAEWRYLAMLNFTIDQTVLAPYVPAGTEIDTWRGAACVSLVGFRFLETRVLGVAVPFHRHFDEINLRFYVRRRVGDEGRRGVTFIREIVPRRAIAVVAKLAYNEPYLACPMRSLAPSWSGDSDPGRVEYAWRFGSRWHALGLRVAGPSLPVEPGSEAEFITEHYWGYTRQRDGGTVEYEVRHPPWRVWQAEEVSLDCDVERMYGPAFAEALSVPPRSAFLALGSEVAVHRPVRVASGPTPSPAP